MKAFRRPQSLPSNLKKTKAFLVDQIMPDLHEEIYSHPQEQTSQESCSGNFLDQVQIEQNYECQTKPLPIPCGPQSKEAEREEELHQELMHVYNDATWKMYYRIQNARKARYIKQRDRIHSEGYR